MESFTRGPGFKTVQSNACASLISQKALRLGKSSTENGAPVKKIVQVSIFSSNSPFPDSDAEGWPGYLPNPVQLVHFR